WDEMAPLEDLERLLRALYPDRRTQRGGHGRPGRCRHELAPIHPLSLRHDPTLRWLKEAVSGIGCRVSGPLTPDTRHLSQRVQHAEGDLVGADGPRVVSGRRAEPLQPERVAPRPVAQQGVADVTQLAGEGAARLSRESRRVRLVHAVMRTQAPVGIEVVAGLSPR